MLDVRGECKAHFRMLYVFYFVFITSFPDDLADGRIVDMGNIWEKMVFDLEIQTTDHPRKYFIVGGKIGCGLELMNCPVIFKFVGNLIRHREFSFFQRVCKLKDYT